MSIANGYHGINVAALGPFFEVDLPVAGDNVNGWPLFDRRQTFATVGGFWDSQPTTNGTNFEWLSQYGGDSAISGIPHWAGIVVDLGAPNILDASTNASTIHNFSTSLDMKNALMNWNYRWTPQDHASFDISYQMFAHRLHINQGFVLMNITTESSINVTIANVLNGECALRTSTVDKGSDGPFIYSAVSPHGVDDIAAYIYAAINVTGAHVYAGPNNHWDAPYAGRNASSIASALHITLQAGQTATLVKYVGIASSDGFAQPAHVARNAAVAAMQTGYEASMRSHIDEWSSSFTTTAVDDFSYPENGTLPEDDYLIEAAITAVTNPYHLLQNTISENATKLAANVSVNSHSISVSGLGSESYAGQIFWDAEIWMQPGLAIAFPFAVKGIAYYRVGRYEQALANVHTAYQSSKKHANFSANAAVFPWTSGRYGNCTATGPCFDYEYHINGDIAQEFVNNWITSGDTAFFKTDLFEIYDSIAAFYSEVMVKNGSKWSLTNMTDPDEYANGVDNGGFTMPLIADTLQNANMFRSMFNASQNATWTSQAENILIGRDLDANVVLEYSGMNGSILVKQADVVLVTFPLSYSGQNYTAADSLSDLDYYASKQSVDGPGMTYAIFSIIANQVSPSGCASFTYQQYSERPYVRAPWYQFSEQLEDDYTANGGTHPAYPFLTGHGGANQVVPFGYLGLRLIPDWSLHVDPALPPQIPQIRYRTIYWHGWPISAFSNQTHTTLSRSIHSLPNTGAVPNATYATMPIPVIVGTTGSNDTLFSLHPNSTITIVNRLNGFNKTTANNVAQCQSVTSADDYLPGQFPISAVDGAASTKWQPTFANKTASITVKLPLGHTVRAFTFDWAQAPPYNYSIIFHNTTTSAVGPGAGVMVSNQSQVAISSAYNKTEALEIVAVQSNKTMAMLSGQPVLYTANHATLTIWGSQANATLTRKNMSGDGATVAEWNIIVQDTGTSDHVQSKRGVEMPSVMRSIPADDNLLKREVTRQLEKLGRYDQSRKRMMGRG